MAMNEIRQQARKSAAERVARLRQQRADLLRTQEELSSSVMTALAERDALIADAERRAGTALTALMATGLSVLEASRWCDVSTRGRSNATGACSTSCCKKSRRTVGAHATWRWSAARRSSGSASSDEFTAP